MTGPPALPRGYLTMVLHAHLPFVRSPEHERFLEENWFYEAVTETYLPLLLALDNLVRDGVDFRLTMSLTPTLISMFDDELLRARYERKLEALIELCEKETVRHGQNPELLATTGFYLDRFTRLRDFFAGECRRDLTGAFGRLQELGRLEILASAATHGYLPLLRHEPSSVRAQVRTGVEHYRSRFGRDPRGIWLPECAYYPGLDQVLAAEGLRYFFLESHGVLRGSTRARHGVHAPVVCPSGVAAFARDPECSRQVWSSEEGFPGHPDYREFYWDLGFEMPLEYVEPYIGADGIRIHTGIKYHRVTGRTNQKQLYVRERALSRAAEHAGRFLDWRKRQIEWLSNRMDRPPIIVAPYDAELFGHWWFEGPEWLNFLLRKAAQDQDLIMTATPSEYLAEFPEGQVSTPCSSSWGMKGHSEFWLNGENDWIYPRLHRASGTMARMAFRHRGAGGVRRRLLNQAGRELLLAQSSDWAFILKSGTAAQYARTRVEEHLGNFERLTAEMDDHPNSNAASLTRLKSLEARNNIFPALRFEDFAEQLPRPPFAVRAGPGHVAFIAAEAAPYVKVGGLADVAGALPSALAALGVRVTVLVPGYRSIDRQRHEVSPLLRGITAPLGGEQAPFDLLEARSPAPRVRVLLVDAPRYFDREGVYVDPRTGAEFPDSAERFVFFTRAALEALRVLGDRVDVVHSHDHQTALAPAHLWFHYRDDPVLGLAASVYTLHNLGYQGVHGPDVLELAGFRPDPSEARSPFLHAGRVNFMKAGVHFAGKVNTVSEGYAREVLADERISAGLGDVLRTRRRDFCGILNGIDVDEWNPERDPHLPAQYNAQTLAGKRRAKWKLAEAMGIDAAPLNRPIVGMITRLVDQKGLDLVEQSLERMLELGIALVILGTGLPRYESFLVEAAKEHPGLLSAVLKFDNPLAHLIEAGADMFLMPSLYEPCGLNQMYSLRYGTVPVVRETGGLADTVVDDDRFARAGTGFTFREYRPGSMLEALERGVRAFRDPRRWVEIQKRGMAKDFSWGASAAKYLELYREALAARA